MPLPHEPVSYRWGLSNEDHDWDRYDRCSYMVSGEALYVRLANGSLVIVKRKVLK